MTNPMCPYCGGDDCEYQEDKRELGYIVIEEWYCRVCAKNFWVEDSFPYEEN